MTTSSPSDEQCVCSAAGRREENDPTEKRTDDDTGCDQDTVQSSPRGEVTEIGVNDENYEWKRQDLMVDHAAVERTHWEGCEHAGGKNRAPLATQVRDQTKQKNQ